jgi:single-strand DNA-binding protein
MNTMITIAGNLAEAPELRLTPAGKANVRMRVAVDSRRRDPASGEWMDGDTSWYTVFAWDALAENLAECLGKGERILVHGRMEVREFTGEDGVKRTAAEITAEEAGPSLRMPARDGAGADRNSDTVPAPAPAPAVKAPARSGPRARYERTPAGRA